MQALKRTRADAIDAAITGNTRPHRSKQQDLLLRLGTGRSYARLQQDGQLTPAGEYYYRKTGDTPPDEFDNATVRQRGATEYLVANGKARVLRRYSNGDYTYTALGRRYFREHTTSYLVNVPGLIKKPGSRSRGGERAVPHTAFMADEPLSVSATMTRQQQEHALKQQVLEHIENNLEQDANGVPILYMDSDPVLYDPDGQWTLDSQTVVQNDAGRVRTNTVLDRELGAAPLLPADMLMPEGLCEEALWDSKGDCVAVQLAALLKLPLAQVHDEIEALWQTSAQAGQESWRTAGVDSRIVGAFATNRGMNCHVVWKGQKIREFRARRNKRKGSIAYAVDGLHAWFYGDTEARRAISHMNVSAGAKEVPESKVAVDGFESKRPEFSEWRSWTRGTTDEGYFECDDLAEARAHYLSVGISPRVSCQGGPITALHVPRYKQHIFARKPYAHALQDWSQELAGGGYDAPYRGESLAVYTHAVVMAFVKNKRRRPTKAERQRVLAKHGNRCAQCGDPGDDHDNILELDHPTPLRDGGDNNQEKIPLCPNCHGHKSYLEGLTPFQTNPLASVFEPATYRAFHESPKPRQAVQQLHAAPPRGTPLEIDTRRCRRSGLEQNQEPIPIFSPLDHPTAAAPGDRRLSDYMFVSKPVAWSTTRYPRELPYNGPKWYWKGAVKYMLSARIIGWEHILWHLDASAHLPHDFFRHVFATIQETLGRVRDLELDIEQLIKDVINALMGLWSTPRHFVYTVETTTCTEDLLHAGSCRRRAVPGHELLYDYIFETELKTWASMRPIHQIVLDMELVWLSMSYRAARRFCEPNQITALFTDAVLCYPSKAQREKLTQAAQEPRHPDGSAVFRLKEAKPKAVCSTEAPVTEPFAMDLEERPWRDFHEGESGAASDELLRLVDLGESCFCNGYGGTGKTVAAKAVARRLLDRGERVLATAYTHVAAQNIRVEGARHGTLHHCLHKFPSFGGWVIVDEASQIPVIVWAAVLRWILSGAKFIVLGDFRSQFGPAYDRWRKQSVVADVENSAMFKRLCGFRRVNFTTYRRGDDRAFFDLYTGMVDRPVAACLAEVRARFPTRPGHALWNLVVSNRHRKGLNAQLNAAAYSGRADGIWVDEADQVDGQGFWLFPGLHLIGCATERGLFNGQLYAVARLDETSVALRVLDSEQEAELPRSDASWRRCLKPAHAMCYYAAQGRTLRGRVRLWVEHPRLTTTHLIVGLSRATSPDAVDAA